MNPSNIDRTREANGGRGAEKTRLRELTPSVDVYESEHDLLVVADLPGVTHERLDIKIDPPELRIETKAENAEGPVWRRSFTIDERIDANKVSAELKNGVLTVHLPKADEVRPRKVAIRGAA
jgi:HSP20 family protein